MLNPFKTNLRLPRIVARVAAITSPHSLLLSNATLAMAGQAISAALGFVFWWLASQNISAHAVGSASATISAMNLVAFVSEFGLGTLMIGQSLKKNPDAPRLITAALVTCTVLTSIIATMLIVFGSHVSHTLASMTVTAGVVFAIGAASTALCMLIDNILMGYLFTQLRMYREFVFSFLKLVFLVVVVAAVTNDNAELMMVASVVAATVVSIVFVALFAARRIESVPRPDFSTLTPILPQAMEHHFLNLAAIGTAIGMPFLVAEVLSPEVNAPFFLAWMVIQVMLLLPASLAHTLFAVEKFNTQGLAHRLRFSLLTSLATVFAGAVGFYLFIDLVLYIFNPTYPELAGGSVKYLGLGMFGITLKHHYLAVMRLEQRMWHAGKVVAAGAVVEVIGSAAGGVAFGTPGFVLCWLLAVTGFGFVTLPTLMRAGGVSTATIGTRRKTNLPDVKIEGAFRNSE